LDSDSRLIVILVAIVILFFGEEKISISLETRAIPTGEFQKGKTEIEREIKKAGKELKKSG